MTENRKISESRLCASSIALVNAFIEYLEPSYGTRILVSIFENIMITTL